MKRLFVAAVIAVGMVTPSMAQQNVIIGHSQSAESHYGKGADAFAAKLAELSGGKWTSSQAPASSLGGERDMIESLQIGGVDMVISSTGPLGNFVPEVYALDLPFLFRDYAHARKVLDGPIGQELLDKVSEHDLVGLAWTENGFRNVTNSKHRVLTPDDLKGLKIRTMENQMHMAAFSAMGASPTPMAFPELFTALQQGVVDGEENPVTVVVATKFWEVQDYLSLTGHVYSPAIILASPVLWNGLSDEEKGWFREAATAAVTATRDEVTRLEETGVELLRSKGMTVDTDIDKAPFADLARPTYSIYTDKYGTDLVDRIIATQ